MKRLSAVACLLLVVTSPGASASVAADPAVIELNFVGPGGAPLVGAWVQVYVWPGDPPSAVGSSFSLQPVVAGVADAAGSFRASLDRTTLASASPGDAADGAGAFNVMAIARAASQQAVWHGVIALGATASATAQAVAVGPPLITSGIGEEIEPVSVTVVEEGYRYIRILAYNCAKGMTCDLTYTYTEGTSRETQAEIAYTYGGTWSAGGMLLEERGRTVETHWKKSGNYHRYVWANYKWLKYAYNCAHCNPWWEWHLHHFQGTISDYNPNSNANGRVIGTLSYSPPPLDTDPNHQVPLTRDNSPWTRDTGQYKKYGFTLSFAGYLGLESLATYGKITSMKYAYALGCSGKRILWGDGTDPVDAPIVQASCVT